ncbi:hypothetical protein Q0590_11015 [Rhodocytophaga aerolata]|uniref:DUF4468 domain-containing protein n=1 Tax=Rhodocytophaga aerolata TaxID=455078 RepID=A0ABT8R520_9BACT|nr:hypothetical protein [Rhodocytophaga aerolata]MDO1446786.1 hypothetical protein [Rhodocytophaga aerolata]
MKNPATFYRWLSILLLISGYTLPVQAQNLTLRADKLRNEENVAIDGWVVNLEQPSNIVEEKLTNYAKTTFSAKPDKRTKNVWVFPKVQLKEITPLRGDLRAVLTPGTDNTTLGFTFSPGYDIHLSKEQYPKELAKLETWVKQYVKYHYTEVYTDQIAQKEKELKNRQSALEKEEKKLTKLRESLFDSEAKAESGDAKATAKNEKNKTEIAGIESNVDKLRGEIGEIEAAIAELNDSIKKVKE